VGGLQLAHTAAHEGIIAAPTIAGDPDVHPRDYVKQPRATYCRPEIASVGLTEQQCEERGLPVKIGKMPFQAVAQALIGASTRGSSRSSAMRRPRRRWASTSSARTATDLIAEASLGSPSR